MVKEIRVSGGHVALVDDEDYDEISQYTWTIHPATNKPHLLYARRWVGAHESQVLMHRQIMAADVGQMVDHINRDGLDNRRENLRIVPRRVNITNSKQFKNNTSGYRGVYWHSGSQVWFAGVGFKGKNYQSWSYSDPIKAALVRDEMARRLYGHDVHLNFPETTPSQEIVDLANEALDYNPVLSAKNTSGYRGVSPGKNGKWKMQITVSGQHYWLIGILDPKFAALIYDEVARTLLGDLAILNFPDISPSPEVIEKAYQALRRHGL